MSEPTLSRRLAAFAADLRFEDLPAEVVDKAKGCVFHNVTAALLGIPTPIGRGSTDLAVREESTPEGARLIGSNQRVSRVGAAFANSAYMNVTNQCDSYYMLTHPGPCIVPGALAVADVEGASGGDVLTALVAGYEVQSRVARDVIATAQSRGFRSAPVFGILGAAIASAKLLGHDEEGIHDALALATTTAAGTLESARRGTMEYRFHETMAARNGTQAAIYAPVLSPTADTCLEGDAGFLNAFTHDTQGALTYGYGGEGGQADLSQIVADLGERWELFNVAFKPFPTPGYNNPVVLLLHRMIDEHGFTHEDVEAVDVDLNWLETSYPSPRTPRPALRQRRTGTTFYVVAQVLVEGRHPMHGQWFEQTLGSGRGGDRRSDPRIPEIMERITVEGSTDRSYFTPRIRVRLLDGTVLEDELAGDELKVGLEADIERMRPVAEATVNGPEGFEHFIEAVRGLDGADSVDALFEACTAVASR